MEDKLKKILATILDVDSIEINDDFSTQTSNKWDSLAHMNVIVAIEDEFQIEINDEFVTELTSFKKIKDYLANNK